MFDLENLTVKTNTNQERKKENELNKQKNKSKNEIYVSKCRHYDPIRMS